MSAIASSELFPRVSQRGGAWIIIAAAHVALIYAVTSGSPLRVALQSAPIEARILESPVQPTETPLPAAPQLETPSIPVVEPPVVSVNEGPTPRAITVTVADQPPPLPAAAAPAGPRLITDVAYIEAPQPRYPPESRRAGEEGLVILRVLINEAGRAARIDIERSSGHSRLDDAAREAVERARFRPYLENGVPRMALATIPIEFNWKSRRADKGASRG